jgi:hypothetical protein
MVTKVRNNSLGIVFNLGLIGIDHASICRSYLSHQRQENTLNLSMEIDTTSRRLPTADCRRPTTNNRGFLMNSWVLTTFAILTLYMLIHTGAAYLRRELKARQPR